MIYVYDSKTVSENKLNEEQPELFYLADGSVIKHTFSVYFLYSLECHSWIYFYRYQIYCHLQPSVGTAGSGNWEKSKKTISISSAS